MEHNDQELMKEIIAKINDALIEMEELVNKNKVDSVSVEAGGYTITFKLQDQKIKKKQKINLKKSFVTSIDKVKSSKIVQGTKNVVTAPFRFVNKKWTSLKTKTTKKIERGKEIKVAFKESYLIFKDKAGFKPKEKKQKVKNKSFVSRVSKGQINKITDLFKPLDYENEIPQELVNSEIEIPTEEQVKEVEYVEPDIINNEDIFSFNEQEIKIPPVPEKEEEFMTNAERFRIEKERLQQEREEALEAAERRKFEEDKAIREAYEREAAGLDIPLHDGSVIELPDLQQNNKISK